MEKFLKWSILDELYEMKGEKFANEILKEMKKQNKELKCLKVDEELTEKIKEYVTDEEKRSKLLSLVNDYEIKKSKDDNFWNKMYYKLGAYDCIEMRKVLENKVKNNDNVEETRSVFFNEYSDDFLDYLEKNRMKILKKDTEYIKIVKKIQNIKEENPNVTTFVEDKEAVMLTDVELNAVLDILELQEEMDSIELKEVFKLGAREMMLFLKQMNLL